MLRKYQNEKLRKKGAEIAFLLLPPIRLIRPIRPIREDDASLVYRANNLQTQFSTNGEYYG